MKKTIIIIVTVLVVLAGTFAGLYFFTGVFNFLKPASDNFSNQLKKLTGVEGKSYSTYKESVDKLKVDSYTSNMNISMNMNLPSKYVDSSTQSLINSSKIKVSGSYDANSNVSASDIGLTKDGKDVLSLSTVLDKQKISITSKELSDKYLTVDLNKYEDFCRKNNIDVDNDTKEAINLITSLQNVDSSNLAYDLLYISEDDYKELSKKYGDLFSDLIDEKNYKTEKNQEVTIDGKDVKTTAYSLTLTGEDAHKILTKLIDSMKDDDTLKKVLIEKYGVLQKYYNSVITSTGDSSADKLPDLTDSQLKMLFSELTKALEESEDMFSEIDPALRLKIYSKNNEPVKFEVIILEDEDDDDGTVIFTEELAKGENTYTIDLENISKLTGASSSSSYNTSSYGSNSKNKNYASPYSNATSSITSKVDSINSAYTSTYGKIIIKDKYEEKNDSRKGEITVSQKTDGSEKEDLITIKYDTVNSKSEFKTDLDISCQGVTVKLACDVTGLDKDTQKIKFDLSGKYSLYSIGLTIDGDITRGKSDVPSLNSSNSVDVFTLSQEEFMKLYTDIIKKASEVLPDRLSAYGVSLTKDQILQLLPTTQTANDIVPDVDTPEMPDETPSEPAA